jgi:predicted lipid-binding transport protein (Tim44 family)
MDILFFAALAFYIFLKLNKNLGKIDDEEKKTIEKKIAEKKKEIVEIARQISEKQEEAKMKIVQPIIKKFEEEQKLFASLDKEVADNFEAILKKCQISADFFLDGAKSAFEMIIKAFAEGDLPTLKLLLSDKIYQGFEAAISNRKEHNKTLITNLIAINKVEILSARIIENNASVVIKILSKQINYITDAQEKIIEGRKDEIIEINDVWTFQKDLNMQDPNWVVTVTAK